MRWKSEDAVAIVTGASSGIGRRLAMLLVERGTKVVAVARRQARLSELVEESRQFANGVGRLIPVCGDLVDPDVRQQVGLTASEIRDGEIDLLVNNAGVGGIGPFADAAPSRLRQIMEINFFAPVELTRICLPLLMKGRAPVVCNISSVLGHRAVPMKSEYCASKFAMHGWSDSVRAEWASFGIQVTLVSPSTTRSEFFDSLVGTDPNEKSASVGSWSPDRVARTAIAAIRGRKSEVICSLGGKALVYADRISPPLMNAVLANRK